MKKIIEKGENICCGTLEKYANTFSWMSRYDENKNKIYLMPNIYNYRINHCPTCGAEIRSVQLSRGKYEELFITQIA